MSFSFNDEAELEFLEAIDYFERRLVGLGDDFAREVFAAIVRIQLDPESWPRFGPGIRRYLTDRFPYNIIYEIVDGEIFIWAVMHQSRQPGYWFARLED